MSEEAKGPDMKSTITKDSLLWFIRESNRIEGILRECNPRELNASEAFLALPIITVADACALVDAYAPGAKLRDKLGMDVRVGRHFPSSGGPHIRLTLERFLLDIRDGAWSPFGAHKVYESIHPFMDGNGRSGRMIWLWQMQREGYDGSLGFLHKWYYQSLEAGR